MIAASFRRRPKSLTANQTETLHLLNGGYGNGDKKRLGRAVKTAGRVGPWVVPKSARIGEEVVINLGRQGLFAKGRVASRPVPREGWNRRYGAWLDSIQLIEPPISLEELRKQIKELKWARYPRSITTPSVAISRRIRDLINLPVEDRITDFDEQIIEVAGLAELRRLALLSSAGNRSKKGRKAQYRLRSLAIRKYVLRRANGRCEGCRGLGPFRSPDGTWFLEAHHTTRLADEGPDHPAKVIGVCPNCHRHAHHGHDAKAFNARLMEKLARIEKRRGKD